jgi:hypothetical protein
MYCGAALWAREEGSAVRLSPPLPCNLKHGTHARRKLAALLWASYYKGTRYRQMTPSLHRRRYHGVMNVTVNIDVVSLSLLSAGCTSGGDHRNAAYIVTERNGVT